MWMSEAEEVVDGIGLCMAFAGDFHVVLALYLDRFYLCVFVGLLGYKKVSVFSSIEEFSYSLRSLYRLICIV